MSDTTGPSPNTRSYTFQTTSGLVIGHQDLLPEHSNCLIYAKGIPYAAASRFQSPQPYPQFDVPYNANKRSPICPQHRDKLAEEVIGFDAFSDLEASEEDCLRLSITLPASVATSAISTDSSPSAPATNASDNLLPVFVWIYGGAYVFGAGDARIYDVSSFVREHDIIAVNITYRVGLFGYIGDGKTKPGNLGLLDQLEALRWVHKNISGFGGDPNNITVAGQSAGADAIVHLLACRDAKGLFRRAMIQSAPLGIRAGRKQMLDALIKRSANVKVSSSVDEVVRGAEDVMSYAIRFGMKGGMPIATQYGQSPLPEESELEEIWKENIAAGAGVDVLIGTTREELGGIVDAVPVLGACFRVPGIGKKLHTSLVGYATRRVYTNESTRLAQLFADAGANVWLYEMTFAAPASGYGSSHSIDLHLQFGGEDVWKKSRFLKGMPWSEVERAAVDFRALQASFVRNSGLKENLEIDGLISYKKIIQQH